ncbi:unnamed protein product [Arctia plantaginis]|uniref:F-box domain-containing protein n=1 Tax=Arctia plantaginis TaxID=874455 RepID=A0A8S0YZ88_ARCPL|nr:unnamed protein product [Arctia plantaginis]
MEEETEVASFKLLPNEIISMILQNLPCRDIISFGSTCKRYHELVNTNQYIWKEKFREILPSKISEVVEKYGDGNWFDEMKRFYVVKQAVYKELMSMSPKFYWRTSEVTLEDIRNFFFLAVSHNVNYHYVVYVLQDIAHRGNKCAEQNIYEKPFTLTDVYYAKIVVRYLTQTFLTLKWTQCHAKQELTSEVVLNFFVQWTDPISMHPDEKVKACIDILVEKVERLFPNDAYTASKGCYNIRDKLAQGLLSEKLVLEGVRDVLYRQHHLTVMAGSSLHGLDIVKVFYNRCGNLIVAAVIFQAVARGCGVHVELIAFPNHLFLEWRSPMQRTLTYKIDLESGELIPQGRCPFAPSTYRQEYKYSPDEFLQYIVTAFLMTMGAIKNWYTQNAIFLLDFLSNNINDDNPYRDFLPSLHAMMDFESEPDLSKPLELEYIHDELLNILDTLSNINKPPTHFDREIEVKHYHSSVTFAVGMLAYHKKYDYLCVVRGWDLNCTTDWRRHVEAKDLEFGIRQPFYSVIAVDQSERYVAQENLIHVDRPTRLYHLEDVIAKEFSHFDGYCYVPNAEKHSEYPEDEAIRQMYRSRAEQRAEELREALKLGSAG